MRHSYTITYSFTRPCNKKLNAMPLQIQNTLIRIEDMLPLLPNDTED